MVWAGVAVRTLEVNLLLVELSSLVLPVTWAPLCLGAAPEGLEPPDGGDALEPTLIAAWTPTMDGDGVAAGTGLSLLAEIEVAPPVV